MSAMDCEGSTEVMRTRPTMLPPRRMTIVALALTPLRPAEVEHHEIPVAVHRQHPALEAVHRVAVLSRARELRCSRTAAPSARA